MSVLKSALTLGLLEPEFPRSNILTLNFEFNRQKKKTELQIIQIFMTQFCLSLTADVLTKSLTDRQTDNKDKLGKLFNLLI